MEKKQGPCFCTALFGVLVIVFAWVNIGWTPIILTILGAILILKGIVNKCCCSDMCKPKNEKKEENKDGNCGCGCN